MNVTIAIPSDSAGLQTRTLNAGNYLVGRSPESDISLAGSGADSVSWNHAEISVRPDGVYLKDLQSSNGTFLNGRRLPVETKVLDGDEVRFGQAGPRLLVQRVGAAVEVIQPAAGKRPAPAVAASAPVKGGAICATGGAPTVAFGTAEQRGRPAATSPAASDAGGRSSSTRALLIRMQRTQRGWRGVGIGVAAFLLVGLIVTIIVLTMKSGSEGTGRGSGNSGGSIAGGSDLDTAAISANFRESVFLVALMQGDKVIPVGTSFVVDPQGVFGTNAHVTEIVKKLLDKRMKMYVIGEGGKMKFDILSAVSHPDYKEKLPAKHFSPDVGLLKVSLTPGVALKPVLLADASDLMELKDGTKLCYIGFPVYMGDAGGDSVEYRTLDEVKPRIEAGNVVRLLTLDGKVGKPETQFIMEHNMLSWGGASGSPIFNRSGRVVALHFAANSVVNKTKAGFLALRSPAGTKFGIRVDKLKDLIQRQSETTPRTP